ncbi:MAG: hypothetical protein ACE5MB_02440 [Anaerolineae bacterium]
MGMKVGLLWYDDDPKRPLADKINEAARRYYEKFGVRPNTCYVNPVSIPEGNGDLSHRQVKVIPTSTILPNHFWLGVAEREG